jgi:hypothetical protein
MRFLIKITIPTAAENPAVGTPEFEKELRDILLSLRAEGTYSKAIEGRRLEYALVYIDDISKITDYAKPIFSFLKVKPEFLPEVVPQPYFGRIGY